MNNKAITDRAEIASLNEALLQGLDRYLKQFIVSAATAKRKVRGSDPSDEQGPVMLPDVAGPTTFDL